MTQGWRLIAELWRTRHAWMWALLLVPPLVVAALMSRPAEYLGKVTIQLDQAHASNPLLQNWTKPANVEILNNTLHRPELLADVGHDAGQTLHADQLKLTVLTPTLLRLSYQTTAPQNLSSLMVTLADTYIYELLAPERLRLEQQLANAGNDLKTLEQQLVAAPSGERAPLLVQEGLLQQQYRQVMDDLSRVNAAFDRDMPHGLMWLAEAPVIVSPPPPGLRLLEAIGNGIFGALIVATLGLLHYYLQQSRRALPEGLAEGLGEAVSGQLPDLGEVAVVPIGAHTDGPGASVALDWQAVTTAGTLTLDPTGFSEIARLHRSLTRNLKGPLLLTSSSSGEGKTLLTALLALRSHNQGKPTLLIDLNLRDHGLSKLFDARPVGWGLQPAAKDRHGRAAVADDGLGAAVIELAPTLHLLPMPSDANTLDVLQDGPQLLALLDRLGASYEQIFIDTTPVLAVNRQNADPLMLAALVRTVLVVRCGSTLLGTAQRTLALLRQQNAQLAGVVANNRDTPDDRALLLGMCRSLERVWPALGRKVRANLLHSVS